MHGIEKNLVAMPPLPPPPPPPHPALDPPMAIVLWFPRFGDTRDLPFDELFAGVVVDRLLGGRYVEHVIVREGLVLAQEDLRLRVRYRRAHLTHVDPLLSQLRSDPTNTVEITN